MKKTTPVNQIIKNVVKRNIRFVLLLIVVVAGVVGFSLIPPQIIKTVIDEHLVTKNANGLLRLGFLYLSIVAMIGIFDFLKGALLTLFGQKITHSVRSEMMKKLERIPSRYFSANGTGFVVSRFTNDVEAISTLFTGGIVGILIDGLKIFGIVVSMAIFHPILGAVAMGLLPIIYLITRAFQKRMLQSQIKNRVQIGRVSNHLTESVQNAQMIHALGKEAYMEDRFTEYLSDNFNTIEKVNFYDSLFPPLVQTMRAVLIAGVVILSAHDWNIIGITIGMVAASVDLLSDLFTPIENLGMELQNMQQSISGIERVNAFFNEEEEDISVDNSITAASLIPDPNQIQLVFSNVSFQYEDASEIFNKISFTINPREKVTFIGRTGVGKTTLFKLTMGLLRPMNGTITLNGKDVSLIPSSEKRKIFGYVEQSFRWVKGTIAEQISLFDPTVSMEDIKKAIGIVGLKEAVESLPNGWDTLATDSLFSQGQKQLLSIARAIVTNPPILLLDEMTANLDSITEKHIITVLEELGRAHIVLSVSHRLSSMFASDTVIVLEAGGIKNMGTPEDLLKNDEWFRNQMTLEKMTWK